MLILGLKVLRALSSKNIMELTAKHTSFLFCLQDDEPKKKRKRRHREPYYYDAMDDDESESESESDSEPEPAPPGEEMSPMETAKDEELLPPGVEAEAPGIDENLLPPGR